MSDLSEQSSESAKPRSRKWLWVILIISLALNFLTVGAIGGTMWAWHHGAWGHGPGFRHGWAFMRELPRERRREIRSVIRKYRGTFRPQRKHMRDLGHEVLKTLKAEPFDEQRFAGALEAFYKARAEAHAARHPMIKELARILTPEERELFAKTFRHRLRGFGHHRWRSPSESDEQDDEPEK